MFQIFSWRSAFVGSALLFTLATTGCAAPVQPSTATVTDGAAVLFFQTQPPSLSGGNDGWRDVPVRQKLVGPNGESGRAFLAYDARNLYARVDVTDDSPLKNGAARPEEMMKGGDAVALYFGDPRNPASNQRVMAARIDGKDWLYVFRPQSPEKKPYSYVSPVGQADFDYVAPLAGASVNFRVQRTGYSAIFQIPWKVLGWDAPPANFAFDVQAVFSDPAGTTDVGSAWWHARGGPGQTVEDLPTQARLYPETWGVARLFDAKTTAISQPASDQTQTPAGLPIRFDLPRDGRLSLVITDQSGWILRELVTAEKRAKGPQTVEWDGRDRYGEALPPGQYKWKALLFDGMGTKFYGSVGNSGRPPYRTADGLGSMGGQHGYPQGIAADAGGVYLAGGIEEGTPALRKIDAQTGNALWKRSAGGFGEFPALAADEGLLCAINLTGPGKAPKIDLLRLDPQSGRDLKMGAAAARRPLALALTDRDQAQDAIGGLAIAGHRAWFSLPQSNRIAGVDLETGAELPGFSVPSPLGLARLDADNLLICSGAQILKLNLTNGTTVPIARGLSAPRAVARDGAGNLYVSDLGDSQQIKKFSSSGNLVASWGIAGGKPDAMPIYQPIAFKNVTALTIGPNGNLWLCETSTPPKRFVKMTTDGRWLEDFYGPVAYNLFGVDLDDFSNVFYGAGSGKSGNDKLILARVNYANYAAHPEAPQNAWRIAAIYDLARGANGARNDLMANVAKWGYGHIVAFTANNGQRYLFRPSKATRAPAPPGAGLWVWRNQSWLPVAYISSGGKRGGQSWRDRNGDGLVQPAELFDDPRAQQWAWIERDLTLDGFDGTLAPQSVDAQGIPDYRGGQFSPYLLNGATDYRDDLTFVSPRFGSDVFYVANLGNGRGQDFWDRADENRVIKIENGQTQWVVGQHDPHASFRAFNTVSGVAGAVDDIIIAHNVGPALYIAYTSDGFLLGNVIADADEKWPSTGPNAVTIESFTGLFLKDPASGKRLLFAVSSGDDRILEVTGPGQTTRLGGEITLDSSRPRRIEAANSTEIPYQTWDSEQARGLGIDAIADEWPIEARGLPIYAGDKLIGDVRLRRDAGSLFVWADVTDATPLQNGEGIELRLAPQNGAPETRIWMTATRDAKGDYQGKVALQKAGAPTAAAGAQVAVKLRWRDLGYRLEAEIPLSLLPEVSRLRAQTFRRVSADNRSKVAARTETLPDLNGPLKLQAAIVRVENGVSQSASWPRAGWGVVATP